MRWPISTAVFACALTGCAMNVTMMSRDSGKPYSGELLPNGNGGGSMNVTTEHGKCSGAASRVSSNDSFGLVSTYAVGRPGIATVVTDGDVSVKALMTCTDGTGLRCEIVGRSGSGGGICVDSASKLFDVIVQRK